MARIARVGCLGKVATPALLQPLEDSKVGIRENDCEAMVWTSALQIAGDIDATFSIEKARRIRNFMVRHHSGWAVSC